MIELIKLELKRTKLTSSYKAIFIITSIMIGCLYFIALIAKVEGDVAFQNYDNLLKLHTGFAFIIYSIFSVVLYSKLIIESYKDKNALLNFSYPICRSKLFLTRLLLVITLTACGFILSTVLPCLLFLITENFTPIILDLITPSLVHTYLLRNISSLLSITAIGLMSLRIGFRNKSITTTMVTAMILSALLGNLLVGLPTNRFLILGVLILFIMGIGFALSTNKLIKEMEV